jgi:hypothetical protein
MLRVKMEAKYSFEMTEQVYDPAQVNNRLEQQLLWKPEN